MAVCPSTNGGDDDISVLTYSHYYTGRLYSSFTIQIIPPKGAAVTITRTLPAALKAVMDLN